MSDELVERARRGDADAFVELIAARQESMVRIAYAILGEPADAEDALQDALGAIWRGLPSLRDPARFGAWSDRILVNACRLTLRRRSRTRIRFVPLGGAHNMAADDAGVDGPRSARVALDAAFERLDFGHRTILVLHHLEGRPLAEIAAALQVPVGTVKSRLHTARLALQRALEEPS